MGKRGFTLVELLAVIVLLGVVMAIAIPTITGITSTIQKNMLEKKGTFIEEAAKLYGQDRRGEIITSTKKYNSYPCKSIIVSDLVPDYLSKDNENNCLGITGSGTIGCIVDPSNDKKYLDRYEVIIYFKNKRIYAKFDIDNKLTCR